MNSLKCGAVTPAWSSTPESCLTDILFDAANLANDASTVAFGDFDVAQFHFLRLEHLVDHVVGRHLRRSARLALQLEERRPLLDVVGGDRGIVDDILDLAGLRGGRGGHANAEHCEGCGKSRCDEALDNGIHRFISSFPANVAFNKSGIQQSGSRKSRPLALPLLARAMRQNDGLQPVYYSEKPLVFDPKSPIVRNETLKPMFSLVSSVVRLRL